MGLRIVSVSSFFVVLSEKAVNRKLKLNRLSFSVRESFPVTPLKSTLFSFISPLIKEIIRETIQTEDEIRYGK